MESYNTNNEEEITDQPTINKRAKMDICRSPVEHRSFWHLYSDSTSIVSRSAQKCMYLYQNERFWLIFFIKCHQEQSREVLKKINGIV